MLITDKNYKDDILIQHYLEKKDYENLFNIAVQVNLPFEEELRNFSLYKNYRKALWSKLQKKMNEYDFSLILI